MMKMRLAVLTVALVLLVCSFPVHSSAGGISVFVDGKPVSFDVPPLLENGRTLVPVRAILEALGASVSWDSASNTAVASRGRTTVALTVNRQEAVVNGRSVPLDAPARIINGRVIVPLRFISEYLGDQVSWDARTSTVRITSSTATSGGGGKGILAVSVLGRQVSLEALPVPGKDGPMLVPVKNILAALGFTLQWEHQSSTLGASGNGCTMVLKGGSSQAEINGKPVGLETAVLAAQSTVFVPWSFFDGNKLGRNLSARMDSQTNTLSIAEGSGLVGGQGFRSLFETRGDLIDGPPGAFVEGLFYDQVFRSLAVSPVDPDVVYVGSEGNGLFKSNDGGRTWARIRNGLMYGVPLSPVARASHVIQYPETYDIAVDPVNRDTVYSAMNCGSGPVVEGQLGDSGGIFKSVDGGSNWRQSNNGIDNAGAASIVIDPANPRVLYAGFDGGYPSGGGSGYDNELFAGGICKSTDAGATWTRLKLPSPAEWSDFWRIIIRSGTVFTLGQKFEDYGKAAGLLKSADSGATWTRVGAPGTHFVEFDADTEGRVIYGVDLREPNPIVLYKSSDGGSSWTRLDRYPAYGPVRIHPQDSLTVMFSNRRDLFKSTDGLSSAVKVATVQYDINDIEYAPSDPRIIYVGTSGLQIYKSTDGGSSFFKLVSLRELITSNNFVK